MTITLNGSTGITTPADTVTGNASVGGTLTVTGTSTLTGATTMTGGIAGDVTATGTVAMASSFKRNRIINGNMLIDQRNAGASVTVNAASSTFCTDRWYGYGQGSDGVFTLQQVTDVPTGYVNSLKATVTTADASIGSTQLYFLSQIIEANNMSDFGWGASGAQTVTLSFWVKSSLTGTFGGALNNNSNYSYPFTFTISAANTWEQKSVTVAGPTAGTWGTGTAAGIKVVFSLGAGSSVIGTAGSWSANYYHGATGQTQIISTNGATFYITGVQLEVGTKATPYEMQIYSDQLAQCQRYYETQDWQQNAFRMAVVFTNSDYINMYQAFVVPKRATPSITWSGNGSGRWVSSAGVSSSVTVNTRYNATATGCSVSSTSTYSTGSYGWLDTLGTMQISAEL